MSTKNRQDENLHTLQQIQLAGNRIVSIDAIEGKLRTYRGNTITDWVEQEQGLYYPVNAFVREYYV